MIARRATAPPPCGRCRPWRGRLLAVGLLGALSLRRQLLALPRLPAAPRRAVRAARTASPSGSISSAPRSTAAASRSTSTSRPATRTHPRTALSGALPPARRPGPAGRVPADRADGRRRGRAGRQAEGAAADPRHAVRLDRLVHRRGVGERRAAGNGWETFVARDLVETIDAATGRSARLGSRDRRVCPRAATARSTSGSTIRGSSSWSRAGRATQTADRIIPIFGHERSLLVANTPLDTLCARRGDPQRSDMSTSGSTAGPTTSSASRTRRSPAR